MNGETTASAGKHVALAGLGATQAITLLMYFCKKLGILDMTPEVAAAIIGLAVGGAGAIMHDLQRRRENRAIDVASSKKEEAEQ